MIPPAEDTVLAGRYRLGRVLGCGGMGEVRAAEDLRLGRHVAVKLLRPELAEQDAVRERFESEGRAAARLNDPHVVTVFDSGEDDGVPFLVMEHLSGRTLADELRDGPMAVGRAVAIGEAVLAGLEAAHGQGIVHRDIKPGNVLIDDDRIKVADFGIAKSLGSDATQTGAVLGTASYVSPERMEGSEATRQSDLYAVGVLLFECLTGRVPFAGASPIAIIEAIRSTPPPDLAAERPDVPPAVAATVAQALAKRPEDRPATAAEMAAGLRSASAQTIAFPIAPAALPLATTSVFPVPPRPAAAVAALHAPARRVPFPLLVGAGTVAFLLVLAIAVAVLASGDGSGTPVQAEPTASTAPPTTVAATTTTVVVTATAPPPAPTTVRAPAPPPRESSKGDGKRKGGDDDD